MRLGVSRNAGGVHCLALRVDEARFGRRRWHNARPACPGRRSLAPRRLCRSGSRRRLQVRRQGPRSAQRWERREACAAGRLGAASACAGTVHGAAVGFKLSRAPHGPASHALAAGRNVGNCGLGVQTALARLSRSSSSDAGAEPRDRLARGLCSLVGTGRHQQRSLPLLCVGMGVEEAAEQSRVEISAKRF